MSPARATSPPTSRAHVHPAVEVGGGKGEWDGGTECHPNSAGFAAVRTGKEAPEIYIFNKRFFFW